MVIPSYGQAQFLGAAIESVLRQSYPPAQIIVVNDGSPDTPLLEQVIAPLRWRVTYIRQENRGLSGARNRGLDACTSDHVVFLDSDDLLLPNALDVGERALADDAERALVWGVCRIIDATGHPVLTHPSREGRETSYIELLKRNVVGPPVGVMFRRDVVVALGGFATDMRAAEDYDLYLRIARTRQVFGHGALIADYRVHAGNMSANFRLMHKYVFMALERQRAIVGSDQHLQQAIDRGIEDAREGYDWQDRLGELYRASSQRKWLPLAFFVSALLTRYPRRFTPILIARVKRLLRGGG